MYTRRDFCRTAICMTAGVTLPVKFPGYKNNIVSKENEMAGRITAVTAEVISQKGVCDVGHKVGDIVKFTETGVDGKICIHALYSLMPKVFAFMYDSKFPWLKDPDVSTHACPDAINPLVFEVKRIREEE